MKSMMKVIITLLIAVAIGLVACSTSTSTLENIT